MRASLVRFVSGRAMSQLPGTYVILRDALQGINVRRDLGLMRVDRKGGLEPATRKSDRGIPSPAGMGAASCR